jgi:hypothetical protein
MSWLDKINNNFTITTGEGSSFSPNWLNATKQKDYNVSEFEFPNVPGTLVYRSLPKGVKYLIEIYFQGDDHLDQSEKFEKAADDNRYWRIAHPFYGLIFVQPLGLHFDNTKYNVSKITGMVVETIVEQFPKGSVDPVDKINFDKANYDEERVNYFETVEPTPSIDVVNQLTNDVKKSYNLILPVINLDIDAGEYFNRYNAALTSIQNITGQVSIAMLVVSDFYNAPIKFTQSVSNRIKGLINQFLSMRDDILNLFTNNPSQFTPAAAITYEVTAAGIISAIATSAVTNMNYGNRNGVVDAIENILEAYNTFIQDLDTMQTSNGGDETSYVPDPISMMQLSDLINFTVTSLFTVALNSKQERVFYLEEDSNLILLAHRLYGLVEDDSTIDTLMNTNEIGLSELLSIKKDRRIVYYV